MSRKTRNVAYGYHTVSSRRTACTLACLLSLTNGSLAGLLHPMRDFDYTPQIGLATAHFDVPPGWRTLPADPRTPHHASLVHATSGNKQQSVAVDLDFYHIHSFQTDKTQQGCADEYLDGIQRHSDK